MLVLPQETYVPNMNFISLQIADLDVIHRSIDSTHLLRCWVGTPEPTQARSVPKTRFYLIKSVIREMKMICFILKIRMSNCLLQLVTWQLYKLIQMVYTSRVIPELFIEVLSHNKSLSNVAISGPNTVNTNPANVCIKALQGNI